MVAVTAAVTLQRANAKCTKTANGRKIKMNSEELKSIAQPISDDGIWEFLITSDGQPPQTVPRKEHLCPLRRTCPRAGAHLTDCAASACAPSRARGAQWSADRRARASSRAPRAPNSRDRSRSLP